ncbi:hypothetical protein BH23ACT9_BH23ACT9_31270 [soil metagenome]
MHAGVTIANHGDYADPSLLADLAVAAEDTGWEGVFVWDHIARSGQPAMTDPWIALAAIATLTARVRIGPMVTPLARRRPWKVAREVTALDHLSAGRVTLGVGLGVHAEEFDAVGEEADPRRRAAMLEESLTLLRGFWSGQPVTHEGEHYTVDGITHQPTPVQPHLPIWVAGVWPNRRPMARAARFDGAFPIADGGMTPTLFGEVAAFIAEQGEGSVPTAGYDLVHEGLSAAGEEGAALAATYADAGVTWWLERLRPEQRTPAQALERIAAGPPRH